MVYLEILLLGITLAVDASIVAFSYGLYEKWGIQNGLKIYVFVLSYCYLWVIIKFANDSFSQIADSFDHWITFLVFLVLGLKIIKDSYTTKEEQELHKILSLWVLLLIGIATSIDALAAGMLIFSQNAPLFKSASLIGGITFLCVILAYSLSKTLTKIPTRILEISAGCILIALGFKVLAEHTLI